MLESTLTVIRCPRPCLGNLDLVGQIRESKKAIRDITRGRLLCKKCRTQYPIISGVSILVKDFYSYILEHAQGMAGIVSPADIPIEMRAEYAQTLKEIQNDVLDEDLESERVTSLYYTNQYLAPRDLKSVRDPALRKLIQSHWQKGPMSHLKSSLTRIGKSAGAVIELGSSVGGVAAKLKGQFRSYLGIDTCFRSTHLARKIQIEKRSARFGDRDVRVDFVVGEIEALPVQNGAWDTSIAMNVIDMLVNPLLLPKTQRALLKPGGVAIQSSPYIWQPSAQTNLQRWAKQSGHRNIDDSPSLIRSLYISHGFTIKQSIDQIPWLFLKSSRQLEIYSVHLLASIKF